MKFTIKDIKKAASDRDYCYMTVLVESEANKKDTRIFSGRPVEWLPFDRIRLDLEPLQLPTAVKERWLNDVKKFAVGLRDDIFKKPYHVDTKTPATLYGVIEEIAKSKIGNSYGLQ